ncbi:IS1634 family transposase [Desulfogranum marinum]|uniref:IS1634 family transposase n=1 Tax=Desulfogranum marinum TaxID=453220 RepID=UPI001963FE3B|nr:transposase [Desulfogranum marinum]MBM9515146.1 transposase [Desulfogranum marinum]
MYLRTTQRKNKDGSVTKYYQLAHNVRHPETKLTTAKIIHSFGRADELDREQLVRLCRSIARVCGVEVIDPLDAACSKGGLPADVKILRTLEYGTVRVIAELWEQLGIGKVIREATHDKGVDYDKAILAMVANRLCCPESKLGVWERWLNTVYLPECGHFKLRQLYEAMDILHENAEEGFWAPQIVVALAVTGEGIPVKSWVFPGNTADVSTVETIKKDLRGWNLGRALFVADSGMNSTDNRTELAKACGTYLLATRMASVSEVKQTVLSTPGRYREISESLHAKEVLLENGKRYILCYNPNEAKRQALHREELVTMLEEELSKHKDRKISNKWAIELLASRRFKRYLAITEHNTIHIDRKAIKDAAKYDGKWVLETNDKNISVEDAARGYRGLMVIERCFRPLKKTQIKMMPMYHWLPDRIESHVKICVLALLIERIAELACDKPWRKIRLVLSKIQATEFATPGHHFYQLNELPNEAKSTIKQLAFACPRKVFGIQTVKKDTAMM